MRFFMPALSFQSLIYFASRPAKKFGWIILIFHLVIGCSANKPAAQQVTHDLAAGMTSGVADQMVTFISNTPTTEPSLSNLSAPQPTPIFIRQHVDPALADMIHTAVSEALRDASGPDAQKAAASMAHAMAEGGLRGLSDGTPLLVQAIRQQLAPAMSDVIRDQMQSAFSDAAQQKLLQIFHRLLEQEIIPSVRQMWDQGATDTLLIPTRPEMSTAVVQNSHNLALGTSFGTHDALIELSILSPTGNITGPARATVWVIAIVLTFVILAATAMLAMLLMIALALWRRPPHRIP
jgi:hypothetical protein